MSLKLSKGDVLNSKFKNFKFSLKYFVIHLMISKYLLKSPGIY